MAFSEQQVIARGDAVRLRALSSYTPEGRGYSERVYRSTIQSVFDDGRLKLKLPVEYGDVVPLSLDLLYEIVIATEQDVFRGQGFITDRFRDEEGSSCMFRLTNALSLETKKNYICVDTRMMAKFQAEKEEEAGHGVITSFSMDRVIMETDQYLDEKAELSMETTLESGRELVFKGIVKETLRLRSGAYESEIQIDAGDIRQQKEIARWLLRHAAGQEAQA